VTFSDFFVLLQEGLSTLKFTVPSNRSFVSPEIQQQLLQGFYNPNFCLPIYQGQIKMQLTSLFPGSKFKAVNDTMINESVGFPNRVQVHYAPSGFGKTFVNSVVATHEYTIYITCTPASSTMAIWEDRTFKSFHRQLKSLIEDNNNHILYGDQLICRFLLARLCHLLVLKTRQPNMTAKEFYLRQLNDNQSEMDSIYDIVEKLTSNLTLDCLKTLMKSVINELNFLKISKFRVVVDEANTLASPSFSRFLT